jgi:hypothetical protein
MANSSEFRDGFTKIKVISFSDFFYEFTNFSVMPMFQDSPEMKEIKILL